MDKNDALPAFAALSQGTRLDVFRLLVRAGDRGMASGEIGEALGVRQNTMSANLSILLNAGLIRNEREGRSVRCFASFPALDEVLQYMKHDCCQGVTLPAFAGRRAG